MNPNANFKLKFAILEKHGSNRVAAKAIEDEMRRTGLLSVNAYFTDSQLSRIVSLNERPDLLVQQAIAKALGEPVINLFPPDNHVEKLLMGGDAEKRLAAMTEAEAIEIIKVLELLARDPDLSDGARTELVSKLLAVRRAAGRDVVKMAF